MACSWLVGVTQLLAELPLSLAADFVVSILERYSCLAARFNEILPLGAFLLGNKQHAYLLCILTPQQHLHCTVQCQHQVIQYR